MISQPLLFSPFLLDVSPSSIPQLSFLSPVWSSLYSLLCSLISFIHSFPLVFDIHTSFIFSFSSFSLLFPSFKVSNFSSPLFSFSFSSCLVINVCLSFSYLFSFSSVCLLVLFFPLFSSFSPPCSSFLPFLTLLPLPPLLLLAPTSHSLPPFAPFLKASFPHPCRRRLAMPHPRPLEDGFHRDTRAADQRPFTSFAILHFPPPLRLSKRPECPLLLSPLTPSLH